MRAVFGAARLLGLLALPAALLTACARDPERPNVLLVVVDTLRADRVSCYGYPRPTTPHIDGLCGRGIRFANVSSTSSWTLPAHASIFTGLFPIEHGATQEHTTLDAGPATLAARLGEHGYATLGVSANPVVSVQSGLARGFDQFEETWRERESAPAAPGEHPNLRAVRRFLGVPRERPFFLFVNYIEVHGPNTPPEPFRSRFLPDATDASVVARVQAIQAVDFYLRRTPVSTRELRVLSDLYDGEVAYADRLVGDLLAELEQAGRLDDTVVILTSDHGENLGDHGHLRHVFSLAGSVVRVPLVIVLPGGRRAGEVSEEPASLLDLFATILALARVAQPERAAGRDLLGDSGNPAPRPVFAEYDYPLQALGSFEPVGLAERERLAPYLRRLRSVELGGLRYVWSSDGRHELFDRTEDPHEERNLAGGARFAESERRLQRELDGFVARGGGERPLPEWTPGASRPGSFVDVDEVSAQRLRELGYLR
jgi:arylsulfatase A-like enzyme